jgi:hypothetical protein
MSTSSSKEEPFDASRRRLCPDGSCIGVLDQTGRCKVCGMTADGSAPAAAAAPPSEPQEEVENEPVRAEADGEGFDPRRRLCPDGSCVGVIGPDGRCKVCGRAGEG